MPETGPSIIEDCRRILDDIDIDPILASGLSRDLTKYHASVMYPPLKTMGPIQEGEIFSSRNNSCDEFTLYVHLPFCSGKCTFCYFYIDTKPTTSSIDRYLIYLKKEATLLSERVRRHHKKIRVHSMFFGGGSPTLMTNNQFSDLLNHLGQCFDIGGDCEATVEIHPEILRGVVSHVQAKDLLENLRRNNINRLNIGVQSFDDRLLEISNRRHTREESIKVYELAREVGFPNINLDLLYPLPDLTPEIWEETLDVAFDLEPDSITTYFTALNSSKFARFHAKSPQRFPDERTFHLMRIMAIEKAKEKGFDDGLLVDWFVKPKQGFHYQHQEKEVKDTGSYQLLSLGSGAYSYYNDCQYYTYPDIDKYCELLEKDEFPCWRGSPLSAEEQLARAMVLGIKAGAVELAAIEQSFGSGCLEKQYGRALEEMYELELLEKTEAELRLTPRGVLFADEVSVQFISRGVKTKLRERAWLDDPDRPDLERYDFMYSTDELKFYGERVL